MTDQTIARQVDDFNQGFTTQIGPELSAVFDGEQADLRASGVPDGVVAIPVPDETMFCLPEHAALVPGDRLIGDGDLSAGIAAAVVGSGVHAVMGTGGAPEGVLTAAAMRCRRVVITLRS